MPPIPCIHTCCDIAKPSVVDKVGVGDSMKGRGGCGGMMWLAGGSLGDLKGMQIAVVMVGRAVGKG
jgi:hypothetical protein